MGGGRCAGGKGLFIVFWVCVLAFDLDVTTSIVAILVVVTFIVVAFVVWASIVSVLDVLTMIVKTSSVETFDL